MSTSVSGKFQGDCYESFLDEAGFDGFSFWVVVGLLLIRLGAFSDSDRTTAPQDVAAPSNATPEQRMQAATVEGGSNKRIFAGIPTPEQGMQAAAVEGIPTPEQGMQATVVEGGSNRHIFTGSLWSRYYCEPSINGRGRIEVSDGRVIEMNVPNLIPPPDFDAAFYLKEYPDVARHPYFSLHPYEHYFYCGRTEHRKTHG